MKFTDLPNLGQPLDGGIFAGITTRQDGAHCAVVLLPAKGKELNWKQAQAWAAKQGGELPTRQEQALLYANCKPHLEGTWHWSCETHEDDASSAWDCHFFNGYQYYDHKDTTLSAVAVRSIEIGV